MFGNHGVAALFIIAFFALAAVLVAAGVGLLVFGLPRAGRRRRVVPLVAGALTLTAVGACMVALSLPPRTVPLTLDLSRSRDASQLDGLGGRRVGDLHIWEGAIALDLRLPGGRTYTGRASLVTGLLDGD